MERLLQAQKWCKSEKITPKMTFSFWPQQYLEVRVHDDIIFHHVLLLEANGLLNNCQWLLTTIASFVCKTWNYLIGALCCMGWRTMCQLSWWLVLINTMRSHCYWLVDIFEVTPFPGLLAKRSGQNRTSRTSSYGPMLYHPWKSFQMWSPTSWVVQFYTFLWFQISIHPR